MFIQFTMCAALKSSFKLNLEQIPFRTVHTSVMSLEREREEKTIQWMSSDRKVPATSSLSQTPLPMLAGEASKAFQMVDIVFRSHHHLVSGNYFVARTTCASVPEESKVISLAENQIGFDEQRAADLSETTVAAAALKAVLVPKYIECLQQIPLDNALAASGALLRYERIRLARLLHSGTCMKCDL
jgi:hypothetical protein